MSENCPSCGESAYELRSFNKYKGTEVRRCVSCLKIYTVEVKS